MAVTAGVDAFLVAGDLFEDDQVNPETVTAVMDRFRAAAPLRIYLLPGNHDPLTGPGCVWERAPFAEPPDHIVVLHTSEPILIAPDVFLVPSPLTQKASMLDPSAVIGRQVANLPANAIRIGITHGSLAIDGRHKPDDFPISLDAASRQELDYLAIGHWHSWFAADGGRILMPGTPEPTGFGERESGFVADVTIPARGEMPVVRQVRTAGLDWILQSIDLTDGPCVDAVLKTITDPARTALRVRLTGTVAPELAGRVAGEWRSHESKFAALQIEDATFASLQFSELSALLREHPLLQECLADLAGVTAICGGNAATLSPENSESLPIDRAEIAGLFSAAAMQPTATDVERLAILDEASRILGATLPEVMRES